tara:strand:+ start:413 stop:898 length:486 start_codon:yes stop_codon:yes gene_type:complete
MNGSMNVILSLSQYDIDSIYFYESIDNNIIKDGEFIKLYYSNDFFSMNGLYLNITQNNYKYESYFQNPEKYVVNVQFNNYVSDKLKTIEQKILEKINISNAPSYRLNDQIDNKSIKLYSKNNTFTSILLKISGIWKVNETYGITYKFIPICDPPIFQQSVG